MTSLLYNALKFYGEKLYANHKKVFEALYAPQ